MFQQHTELDMRLFQGHDCQSEQVQQGKTVVSMTNQAEHHRLNARASCYS